MCAEKRKNGSMETKDIVYTESVEEPKFEH